MCVCAWTDLVGVAPQLRGQRFEGGGSGWGGWTMTNDLPGGTTGNYYR